MSFSEWTFLLAKFMQKIDKRTKGGRLTHGMRYTKIYQSWTNMKARCFNKNYAHYNRYGGRGIIVCERWMKFKNFRDDMYENYLKHIEKYGKRQTTLDRKNNDGNYELGNCRWTTQKEQMNNTNRNIYITFESKTQTIISWAKELKIRHKTLNNRIMTYKWSIKRAITEPVRKYIKH